MPLSALPAVIGHRCARAMAPENTLAGLDRAAAAGVTWVEVDIRLTADGVPVLLHDATLERTTNGVGALSALSAEALSRLEAGLGFGTAFAGATVPTLEAFLGAAARLGIGVNLEIKGDPDDSEATASAAMAIARTVWPQGAPAPLISSFEIPALEAARRLAPEWPRGLLFDLAPPDWQSLADRLDVAAIIANHRHLTTPEAVAALSDGGRSVLAYTVNDPAVAARLGEWGVTAIFTDRPDAEIFSAMIRRRKKSFIYGSMVTSSGCGGYETSLNVAGGEPSPPK